MKKLRKLLAILTALAMFVSVLTVSMTSFAATTKNVKQYKVYTAFGDSIPAGFSEPTYAGNSRYNLVQPLTRDSYVNWVGKYVGAETVNCCARLGERTHEFRHVLDPSYPTDVISQRYLPKKDVNGERVIDEEACAKLRAGYIKLIKQSDLITLNYGGNDSGQPLMYIKDLLTWNAGMAEDALDGETTLAEFIDIVKNSADNSGKMLECVKCLLKAQNDFNENFDYIVKFIHKVNPNATIVAVGLINPLSALDIETPQGEINIGHFLNIINDANNRYMKSESPYRDYYTFVNVQGVDTFMSEINTDEFMLDPHPTPSGHKEYARRIIAQLPTR